MCDKIYLSRCLGLGLALCTSAWWMLVQDFIGNYTYQNYNGNAMNCRLQKQKKHVCVHGFWWVEYTLMLWSLRHFSSFLRSMDVVVVIVEKNWFFNRNLTNSHFNGHFSIQNHWIFHPELLNFRFKITNFQSKIDELLIQVQSKIIKLWQWNSRISKKGE